MDKETPTCCPYCSCTNISKTKDKGMIEIGPLEFSQDEEYPVDIWVCSECRRRFVILDDSEDES